MNRSMRSTASRVLQLTLRLLTYNFHGKLLLKVIRQLFALFMLERQYVIDMPLLPPVVKL